MESYRGNKLWDWRVQTCRTLAFAVANGREVDEVRRRALTVLRSVSEGACLSLADLDGPMWALLDTSHDQEAVKGACLWFRAAAAYSDDEEVKLMLCREAYGKVERALGCYL